MTNTTHEMIMAAELQATLDRKFGIVAQDRFFSIKSNCIYCSVLFLVVQEYPEKWDKGQL